MWRKRKSNTDLLTPAGAIMPARKQNERRIASGSLAIRNDHKLANSNSGARTSLADRCTMLFAGLTLPPGRRHFHG